MSFPSAVWARQATEAGMRGEVLRIEMRAETIIRDAVANGRRSCYVPAGKDVEAANEASARLRGHGYDVELTLEEPRSRGFYYIDVKW